MRLVFFGSGSFGVPTLRALNQAHRVLAVVSQPDRPAGRQRQPAPTPVSAEAATLGLPLLRPPRPDAPAFIDEVRALRPGALVVIAYGHKLCPALLEGHFAINLHASLLPRYRGAAPINWAIIRGEPTTGLSVITLDQVMDGGLVLARVETAIDPMETAGELHDRLAALGPDLVLQVLAARAASTLRGEAQDKGAVTQAPKLTKRDGTVRFDQPAEAVRARVHGLSPWPGCTVLLGPHRLRLHRVALAGEGDADGAPGRVGPGGVVSCRPGAVRLLEVQSPGGRMMGFQEWSRGHVIPDGARCEATQEQE
jgi:methionyl-tRNA formyltransferase